MREAVAKEQAEAEGESQPEGQFTDSQGNKVQNMDIGEEPLPPPERPAPGSETGGDRDDGYDGVAQLEFCPHCGWDLAMPDIPEPDDAAKQAFLVSILGHKPFIKTYDLMGGALSVTFRSLTSREIDQIYRQAYRERDRGELKNDADAWERINRLRLYLQLLQTRSNQASRDLPDGLSPATTPHATTHWSDTAGASSGELFLTVENHVLNHVLTTESIHRIVYQYLGQFNRLVSKMEAMTASPDFWKATEPPA